MSDPLDHRCGSCARFVRAVEVVRDTGEVVRQGECLLGVWPAPLYETSTCSQWVRRGEFRPRPENERRGSRVRSRRARAPGSPGTSPTSPAAMEAPLTLPEDLLAMDEDAFRKVLTEVLRDELGLGDADLAPKWEGGEMILRPGREGLQEKRVPLDALFNKIVMIRDRLRVLEQKVNSHPKLTPEEKLQMQQYVTGCYGSLTTFNVLFANREDQFVGQKGED
jgi:hypothetical protein